jgi:hypothetical protein
VGKHMEKELIWFERSSCNLLQYAGSGPHSSFASRLRVITCEEMTACSLLLIPFDMLLNSIKSKRSAETRMHVEYTHCTNTCTDQ